MDLDAALAAAKMPERTVDLCLRGDLQALFESLESELRESRAAGTAVDSLAGDPHARELAEQITALQDDMAAHTVTLTVRGITNPHWNKLVADCPVRDGNSTDRALGYDVDKFFPLLVKTCLLDVTDEQWQKLYATISAGQFEALSDASLAVSRRRVDVPKSLLASEVLRISETSSPSPAL